MIVITLVSIMWVLYFIAVYWVCLSNKSPLTRYYVWQETSYITAKAYYQYAKKLFKDSHE